MDSDPIFTTFKLIPTPDGDVCVETWQLIGGYPVKLLYVKLITSEQATMWHYPQLGDDFSKLFPPEDDETGVF